MCDCVLVEPMGKVLSPSDYVSAGLVVCIFGCLPPEESEDEVVAILKESKWLDSGLSVCFPDLQAHCGFPRQNLEKAISTTLTVVGVETCVLVGKEWGGHICVETLSAGNVKNCVSSCILIAPGELIEQANERIGIPALLVWARDDEVSDFREARAWVEALHGWRSPCYAKEVKKGGHDLKELLDDGSVANAMSRFAIVTLVLVGINNVIAQNPDREDVELTLPHWLARLLDELPPYIAELVGGPAPPAEKEDAGANSDKKLKALKRGYSTSTVVQAQVKNDNATKTLKKTASQLREWIRGGMHQITSNSTE